MTQASAQSPMDMIKSQLVIKNDTFQRERDLSLMVLQNALALVLMDTFFAIMFDDDENGDPCFKLSLLNDPVGFRLPTPQELDRVVNSPDHTILIQTHLNASGRTVTDTLDSIAVAVKHARTLVMAAREGQA